MPKDEGPTHGREWRYSEAERTMMVQAVLAQLTPAEAVMVRVTGDFPGRTAHARLRTAYSNARAAILHYRDLATRAEKMHAAQAEAPDGSGAGEDAGAGSDAESSGSSALDCASEHSSIDAEVQGDLHKVWAAIVASDAAARPVPPPPSADAEPSHEQIKKEAKFWTKRFLTHGNVRDLPPSVKGTKRRRIRPTLLKIRAKILRGWVDASGRTHAYFSLHDLERRDRRAFAADAALPPNERKLGGEQPYHELKESLGVKHNRYVWAHLKAEFPRLRRVQHSVRRQRKRPHDVVKCASTVLGELPMEFEASIHRAPQAIDACAEAGIINSDQRWFWKHENGYQQWWIDALTVDPSKVLLGQTVLWDSSCGQDAPVHESDIVNARPGGLPQIKVYLATHAEHGTVAFIPALGCKGGGQGSCDGVQVFTKSLTPADVELLKVDMRYYVQPKALTDTKRDAAAVAAHAAGCADGKFSSADVDPQLFLTYQGRWPQNTTAPEFAAMFDLVMLPKLRSFHLSTLPDGSVDYADYAAKCRKFATEELKLPARQWSKVHLPAYISMDNDTTHDWARKLCFRPRQPESKLLAPLGARFCRDFGPPSTYDGAASEAAAQCARAFKIWTAQRGPDEAPAVQAVASMLGAQPLVGPERWAVEMRKRINAHDDAHGCDWVQDQLHELSLSRPGMICLVPQQFMPLTEVTPDIHCVIEHLVGTIKRFIRDRLLDFDVPDDELKLAVTYERWLNEALAQRANGEAGKHHVRRSIDKQKCICQILRTPAGVPVTVQYVFGSARSKGGCKVVHDVRGTGGAWIRDGRWT